MDDATSGRRCRFSIVVPTYNYGRYLGRALDSVLAQSGDDFELIVSDDGSNDDTADVLKAYAHRVRYYYRSNHGVSAARNFGADQARGEYLLFLDADDRLLPDALATFRRLLDGLDEPPHLAFGGYVSVNRHGHERVRRAPALAGNRLAAARAYLRRRFSIAHGTAIVRRDAFQQVRYPEELQNNEDLVLFGRLLARHGAWSFSEPVVAIHAHEGRLRDNFAAIQKMGTRAVDLLFDPNQMPAELMPLRTECLARHLLTQARACERAGQPVGAAALYRQARRLAPRLALQWTTARKYLRVLYRAWRAGRTSRRATA